VKSAQTSLSSSAAEILSSDDRAITQVPKILDALQQGDREDDDPKQIEKWCNALASFRATEVKHRLDHLQQVERGDPLPDHILDLKRDELRAERDAIKEELETLKAEIASVAEMVVQHDFREPLLRSKKTASQRGVGVGQSWLDYVRE
jgi:hypothetical protein